MVFVASLFLLNQQHWLLSTQPVLMSWWTCVFCLNELVSCTWVSSFRKQNTTSKFKQRQIDCKLKKLVNLIDCLSNLDAIRTHWLLHLYLVMVWFSTADSHSLIHICYVTKPIYYTRMPKQLPGLTAYIHITIDHQTKNISNGH